MSYIAPNSTIRLYANVPLDNSYTNTIWFTSKAEQDAYFHGSADVITTLSNQYYQRATRNSLKVQVPIGSCYHCNYLAFRNNSFENKWFYAFVTDVEYINNEVTEIFYELDVMQTYRFDVFFNACYVEREHCAKGEDVIGNFILPEPVSVDDYNYDTFDLSSKGSLLSSYIIVVQVADIDTHFDPVTGEVTHPTSSVSGAILQNTYSGCSTYVFSNANSVNSFIENWFTTKPDGIISIYMCPSIVLSNPSKLNSATPLDSGDLNSLTTGADWSALSQGSTFGGYAPLNNKLYTYPYNAFVCSTPNGESKLYRYEWFDNFTPSFRMTYNIFPPVTVTLTPLGYKIRGIGNQNLFGDGLTLADYPMCSWTMDSYQMYCARNWLNLPIRTMGTAVGLATEVKSSASGMFDTISSELLRMHQAKISSDYFGGTIMSGSNAFASNTLNFYGGRAHIPAENARVIDNYFSLYGYQTNKVKVPNFNSRPVFNYVKIVGECCEPADNSMVNASDIDAMNKILNNGITFWHTTDHYTVGNYTTGAGGTLERNNA